MINYINMTSKISDQPEISIILPCRNEEKALFFCIKKIKEVIQKNNLKAQIIVSDSSTDNSPEIAKKENVILVKHNKKGYGTAYLEAFPFANGKYIFMADADGTYDFNEIFRFLCEIKKGYDFIIGNRFGGNMEIGAMPKNRKLIGNPLLSFLINFIFNSKIKDSQCGMRLILKEKIKKLNLKSKGMEFASEMIIKSLKNNLKIKELDIGYKKRIGKSKLRSVPDGIRHLILIIKESVIK